MITHLFFLSVSVQIILYLIFLFPNENTQIPALRKFYKERKTKYTPIVIVYVFVLIVIASLMLKFKINKKKNAKFYYSLMIYACMQACIIIVTILPYFSNKINESKINKITFFMSLFNCLYVAMIYVAWNFE